MPNDKKKINIFKPNNVYVWIFVIIYSVAFILALKFIGNIAFIVLFILITPYVMLIKKFGDWINKGK